MPVIIIAPHGNQEDDQNTDVVADAIACTMNAYSVINIGWQRAPEAILGENKANLNNIKHCLLDPVRKEFLDPIFAFKDEILSNHKRVHILHIHGMSNTIRDKTKDNVDIVVGYGQGNPPSFTCDLHYKTAVVVRFREEGFNVYQGKSGGRFSAWKHNNLTQLFRHYQLDQRVHSMQLEIVNVLRANEDISANTGLRLGGAFDRFLHRKTAFSRNIVIKEY